MPRLRQSVVAEKLKTLAIAPRSNPIDAERQRLRLGPLLEDVATVIGDRKVVSARRRAAEKDVGTPLDDLTLQEGVPTYDFITDAIQE